jgi:hypothetical protein
MSRCFLCPPQFLCCLNSNAASARH